MELLLTNTYRDLFRKTTIDTGADYYLNGQVELDVSGDDYGVAWVFEKEGYEVVAFIDWVELDLNVGCNCSGFRKEGVCRHLWGAFELFDEVEVMRGAIVKELHLQAIDEDRQNEVIEDFRRGVVPYRPKDLQLTPPSPHPSPGAVVKRPSSRRDPSPVITSGRKGKGRSVHGGSPLRGTTGTFPQSGPELNPLLSWNERIRSTNQKILQPVRRTYHGIADRELLYVLRHGIRPDSYRLRIDIAWRQRRKNGEWGSFKFWPIKVSEFSSFESPLDREFLSLIDVERSRNPNSYSNPLWIEIRSGELTEESVRRLLPEMAREDRLIIAEFGREEGDPLTLDPEPIVAELIVRREEGNDEPMVTVDLRLVHGDQQLTILDLDEVIRGGFVLHNLQLIRMVRPEHFPFLIFFRDGKITLEEGQLPVFLQHLSTYGSLPSLRIDENLIETEKESTESRPVPHLQVSVEPGRSVVGSLEFLYNGTAVLPSDAGENVIDVPNSRFIERSFEQERIHIQELRDAGFALLTYDVNSADTWQIRSIGFAEAAAHLVRSGWKVTVGGKPYRTAPVLAMDVTSREEWFDIAGDVRFDEGTTGVTEMILAIDRGEHALLLNDGSYGMIPDEWFNQFSGLKGLIDRKSGKLKIRRNQVLLLDLLLAGHPESKFDEVVAEARGRLDSFTGITPLNPPRSFRGKLRPYQSLALGWFAFLREFGIGGCLADDMGLGKTVQGLALLESRRVEQEKEGGKKPKGKGRGTKKGEDDGGIDMLSPRPSLVVVPKSLIFNWMREAETFAPKMKVLDYTGPGRKEYEGRLEEYDLILTTYGTLRRDIEQVREILFDYVILDESQAIKNATSQTAKVVRLLRSRYRLAMSGTPVENRIEELWSLFEFLNPGMLGTASVFRLLAGTGNDDVHKEQRAALARALRPFILRRTKREVAPDLPEKTEQTLICELSRKERDYYERLRESIRSDVFGHVDSVGLNRSSMKVLEGLLRLRQAACHPGLIESELLDMETSKFEMLLPMLEELIAEGHKALVFSQFTSYLALLRQELDERGIPYEYLDGQTRDRGARVDRFQNDPEVPLFLISLKAGGVGLNLTAAEYVFLLDPWWNPAVEAQAIDRTHRIGQTNPVVARRLIARDTVEERVLDLQQKKRELADSLVSGDNSLISELTREDLEALFS